MLLTNKTYTQEAIDTALKIANEVELRHAKWLVNRKYLLEQSQVDNLLSLQGRYCDDVIFNEDERITRNQRILLMCEQARVKERNQRVENRQKTLKSVVADVTRVAEQMLIQKLNQMPMEKLCGEVADFAHFSSIAYSPSLSFTKLSTLTTLSHRLSATIVDLVSNPKFCERLGRQTKNVQDAKVAIGLLGIENCRMLFPVLMARPMLKWGDHNTKFIVPKMWQHLIVTSNVTRMRLQDADIRNPDAGVLIGVLRCLGQFVIANHFTLTFEDALIEVMLNYRNHDRKEEYYACADVVANPAFLPKVIYQMEGIVTRRILDSMDWPSNAMYIKDAVLEDLDKVPVLERSSYGAALAQAKAYSIFDGLSRSNAFVEAHKPFWFANVQISAQALKETRARMPGKMILAGQSL
ncbi:HDOD domain-containing protein [Vibrio sp. CAU 1672]|uniref:HDOD domain-containing protein n=1 Tax=Vibrio sp. CAU 1672 TaxID=3032594 RepID=UPI0023DBD55C|nr:HDOD domain-containing protein [Vibrio sp. CAU 1672]MDF2152225.1 HDOD domain-containing protein [Vibrio sp. CAU 1672]